MREKNETLETQIGVITWNVEQHYRLHFYLLSDIFLSASFLSHFVHTYKSHFGIVKLPNYLKPQYILSKFQNSATLAFLDLQVYCKARIFVINITTLYITHYKNDLI